MIEIQDRVSIPSSPDVVFRFAARPENMHYWIPAVIESRVVGRLKAGATVIQRVRLFGRLFETTYDVTAYEPCLRVIYTSTSGPVYVRGTMDFHPEEGGTSVRWVVEGDCHGFLRVSEGVLLPMGRREMRQALQNLRRLLGAARRP
jgi:Polyketide cyclase / dehydrase and lipid transport